MKIEHHIIETPQVEKPEGDWKQNWYGLWRIKECYSDEAWQAFKNTEAEAHRYGLLGERELEVDIFLSIMEDIKAEQINFVELGAGYGDWCMAVNGVVRYKLVDTKVKTVNCYAVEAEPTHYDWCVKHFKQWDIEGAVHECIISDKIGKNYFAIDADPSSNYGQSEAFTGSLLSTVGNILRRKRMATYSITLDELMSVQQINRIHYLDMDVQGNELRVMKGAVMAIINSKIDYIKIGTHGHKYNKHLANCLKPYYELLVDIEPFSVGGVNGLKAKVEDGIQVYRRHGL